MFLVHATSSAARTTAPFDCAPRGWNYSVVYPAYDPRFSKGHAVDRCGYGFIESLRAVRVHAARRPLMIDVGANVGQSLLPLASLGWDVLAFEPSPHNAEVINKNVGLNAGLADRVQLVDGVASNVSGTLTLHVPVNGREDNAALVASAAAAAKSPSRPLQVKSVTLDDVFVQRGLDPSRVHYIKIDTQGHEVAVLQGMHRLLRTAHKSLVVKAELDPWLLAQQGQTPDDVLRVANAAGLALWCGRTCVRGFARDGVSPSGCSNDVILNRSLACLLQERSSTPEAEQRPTSWWRSFVERIG